MLVHVHCDKGDDRNGSGSEDCPFQTLEAAFRFVLTSGLEPETWRIKYWLWTEKRWQIL
jgi:hypothetical protein